MLEKRFAAVPAQVFTADGGANGLVSIADTSLFKVKQAVIIASNTQINLEVEVKNVISSTQMIVGSKTGSIFATADISAYLVTDGANVSANEQKRPNITNEESERASYEEEPTVAKRVVLVDELGNKYSQDNPLPTTASISVGGITIDAVGQGNPNSLANGWPVKVTDGTNVLGTSAHPIKIDGSGVTQPVSGPLTNSQFRANTATRTSIGASLTDVLLIASNANRRGILIYNASTVATLFIGFGTTTTDPTSYSVEVGPNGVYEAPFGFTGEIRGFWNSTNGSVLVTEFL